MKTKKLANLFAKLENLKGRKFIGTKHFCLYLLDNHPRVIRKSLNHRGLKPGTADANSISIIGFMEGS